MPPKLFWDIFWTFSMSSKGGTLGSRNFDPPYFVLLHCRSCHFDFLRSLCKLIMIWRGKAYSISTTTKNSGLYFFMFCQSMSSLRQEFKRTSTRVIQRKHRNMMAITNDLLKWPDWRFMLFTEFLLPLQDTYFTARYMPLFTVRGRGHNSIIFGSTKAKLCGSVAQVNRLFLVFFFKQQSLFHCLFWESLFPTLYPKGGAEIDKMTAVELLFVCVPIEHKAYTHVRFYD